MKSSLVFWTGLALLAASPVIALTLGTLAALALSWLSNVLPEIPPHSVASPAEEHEALLKVGAFVTVISWAAMSVKAVFVMVEGSW